MQRSSLLFGYIGVVCVLPIVLNSSCTLERPSLSVPEDILVLCVFSQQSSSLICPAYYQLSTAINIQQYFQESAQPYISKFYTSCHMLYSTVQYIQLYAQNSKIFCNSAHILNTYAQQSIGLYIYIYRPPACPRDWEYIRPLSFFFLFLLQEHTEK